MRIYRALIAATLLASASSVMASVGDRNGAEQINAGDFTAAERIIIHERAMFPQDPDLALNLAAVYIKTGRLTQARALYQEVLTRPDEPLAMSNGQDASAHAIAALALRRIEATTLSAR
ncbi:MAG: tetratricopeptide repeat protein [Sphingomonas sp.]|jgi:Flp pilus assembly protein TadD